MIAQPPASITAATPPVRRRILGIRVDDVTWDEALERVRALAAGSEPGIVVTPNPEIVMRARRDPALAAVIEAADLAPADGVGLRWAGRLLGRPIREVVPGSDLVVRLAEASVADGLRWFLLGGEEGVAAEAAAALRARHPGLRVAGTFAGSPRPEDDEAAVRQVRDAGEVHVLLVAYGAPGQELWIARNQPRLRIPVAIGVGGTFNFLAGRSPEPSERVRRLNLIWLHRLATEPWRWRRQLALVRFVGAVLAQSLAQRLRVSRAARTSR